MPRLPRALSALLILLPGSTATNANPPAEVPVSTATVTVEFGAPDPWLPLPQSLLDDLAANRFDSAAKKLLELEPSALGKERMGDHAFLLGWSLVRAGRAAEAADLVPAIRQARLAPSNHASLLEGEILLATGDPAGAALALGRVDGTSRLYNQAQTARARSLLASNRQEEALQLLQELAKQSDPAPNLDQVLLFLAEQLGTTTEPAYPHLRRLWAAYPGTPQGKRATSILAASGPFPTWQEVGVRGASLMGLGRFKEASTLLAKNTSRVGEASPEACRYWFAHGRSLFRQNRVTEAERVLSPAGTRCVGHDADRSAKSFYLAGKSLERKGAWASAAIHYSRIADQTPDHSYADDGLLLAGIAFQEAGDPAKAQASWARQVNRYPAGDMAGEAFWRLAWSHWLAGDTEKALAWTDRAVEELPLEADPVHHRAARYWSARWRLYPDREHPTQSNPDQRQEAIDRFAAICRDHPYSWYGVLAAARLAVEAPDVAKGLPTATLPLSPPAPWQHRVEFQADPSVKDALALYRLGLPQEALLSLDPPAPLQPAEAAWMANLRAGGGDWLGSHDALRQYLASHPAEQLGEQGLAVLDVAYPDTWWAEVQTASQGHDFDPRLFHALVREESNFNKNIVSYAGARGLSQLMPATGKRVAAWMGLTVSRADLFAPATNLPIGARYLQFLVERYGGNPALALAGYNAGEGNVGKWLAAWGNLPTDEYVESIPFRQTRHYVKRVSTTWQVYHRLRDGGAPFVDLSAYMHQAVPDPAL